MSLWLKSIGLYLSVLLGLLVLIVSIGVMDDWLEDSPPTWWVVLNILLTVVIVGVALIAVPIDLIHGWLTSRNP